MGNKTKSNRNYILNSSAWGILIGSFIIFMIWDGIPSSTMARLPTFTDGSRYSGMVEIIPQDKGENYLFQCTAKTSTIIADLDEDYSLLVEKDLLTNDQKEENLKMVPKRIETARANCANFGDYLKFKSGFIVQSIFLYLGLFLLLTSWYNNIAKSSFLWGMTQNIIQTIVIVVFSVVIFIAMLFASKVRKNSSRI